MLTAKRTFVKIQMTNVMKRGFLNFWILYALFFAIPFPMILYYNINREEPTDLANTNPWCSLFFLALSVCCWAAVLIGYYRKWILRIFSAKRTIEQLKTTGIRREATILESDGQHLRLLFKNLADHEIEQKMKIRDSKPYEQRFIKGKRLTLLIDPDMKNEPYFIADTVQVAINTTRVILIHAGWLLLLATVIGYYIFSYQTQNEGMGWRFLVFWHPLLLCPAILLGYRGAIRLLFNKFGGNDLIPIKFKGLETTARLIKASETGTYINDQPMIKFELEYTDHKGKLHRNELKKVVGLLNLEMTKQETISIYFMKDDPSRIAFSSDLNEIDYL